MKSQLAIVKLQHGFRVYLNSTGLAQRRQTKVTVDLIWRRSDCYVL